MGAATLTREIARLDAVSRERELSEAESHALGVLIGRQQREQRAAEQSQAQTSQTLSRRQSA